MERTKLHNLRNGGKGDSNKGAVDHFQWTEYGHPLYSKLPVESYTGRDCQTVSSHNILPGETVTGHIAEMVPYPLLCSAAVHCFQFFSQKPILRFYTAPGNKLQANQTAAKGSMLLLTANLNGNGSYTMAVDCNIQGCHYCSTTFNVCP